MKTLTSYQKKKVTENLRLIYEDAKKEDISNGLLWYYATHGYCAKLAARYRTDTYTVAAVLSALSPNNRWEQNKKDTETVLSAVTTGLKPEDVKVCTFHRNKNKAFEIAKGNQSLVSNSLKTFNFLNNIAFLCEESITVDIWHLRACFMNMIVGNMQPTQRCYEQIRVITLTLAKEYNVKGFEFQAIIWLAIKRLYEKL